MTEQQPTIGIAERRNGDQLVLTVSGEVDLATAPTFKQRLDEAVTSAGSALVVDLGDVDFIDSTGLRMLLEARSQADDAQIVLVLRNVVGPARKMMDVAGVTDLFTIE